MFEQETSNEKNLAFKVFMGALVIGGIGTMAGGTALAFAYLDSIVAKDFIAGVGISVTAGVAIGTFSALIIKNGLFKTQDAPLPLEVNTASSEDEYSIHYTR